MGSPKFVKIVFWMALLIGGAVYGIRYIERNPDVVDIRKTQPGVYRPQPAPPPGGNGGQIVTVP